MNHSLKFKTILFLCVFTLISSCKKDPIPPAISINEASSFWDGNPDKKLRFQLRMALAKTVSAAFTSRIFTDWFMEKGFVTKENHFDELLLARHANDIVGSSGKTLIEFLEMHADAEVLELFGTDFFELVFEHDPCVVIKMPDIFREVEWDPEKMRPVVVPQLPYTDYMEIIFGEGKWFPVYFGGKALSPVYDPKTYFYVAIKYSEDYMLLDPTTMLNERGLSFYEILPQAKECENGMLNEIVALGEPHPSHPEMILIYRLNAFFQWQQLCGFKGKYWSRDNQCMEECIRTCIPINESVYVIDSFRMNGHVIFQILNNDIHLADNHTYTWSFWNVFPQEGQFTRFTVPALPHEWFDARHISITFFTSSIQFPPRIKYVATDRSSDHYFPVKMKFKTDVVPEDVSSYRFNYVVYAERMDPFVINHPFYSAQAELNAAQVFPDHLSNIFGCDPELYLKSNYSSALLTY